MTFAYTLYTKNLISRQHQHFEFQKCFQAPHFAVKLDFSFYKKEHFQTNYKNKLNKFAIDSKRLFPMINALTIFHACSIFRIHFKLSGGRAITKQTQGEGVGFYFGLPNTLFLHRLCAIHLFENGSLLKLCSHQTET